MTNRRVHQPATRANRHSIRLKDYDYSTPGAYFVTICTAGRRPTLRPRHMRHLVHEAWAWLASRFDTVELDEFIAMPDHIHFVLWLLDGASRRGGHPAAQGGQTPAPTLSNVVGAFKTVSAKAINRTRNTVGQPVWQRNFFERVVRNERELKRIRSYIRDNPYLTHSHSDEDDFASAWEPA